MRWSLDGRDYRIITTRSAMTIQVTDTGRPQPPLQLPIGGICSVHEAPFDGNILFDIDIPPSGVWLECPQLLAGIVRRRLRPFTTSARQGRLHQRRSNWIAQ
jgi:hypothetical protein